VRDVLARKNARLTVPEVKNGAAILLGQLLPNALG
jgi:hypothetical protein